MIVSECRCDRESGVNAIWFQRFLHACQWRKGHHRVGLFLSKVRLHLMFEHYTFSLYVTHTQIYVHTLNILHLFCFWEGGLSLLCSTYLSKLDAGSGCLTASVKLWCDSLILGSMHLEVFIIIIFKKVEETSWMEAFGSVVHLGESKPLACWRWMESSGQGFGVPTIFQSYIPGGWFCLMNGLYCGEEVKRSMSLLSFAGVCMCHGDSCSHLVAVEDLNTFSGVFYQNRIVVSF